MAFKQFAHPELKTRNDNDYSFSNEIAINNFGPIFFYAVCMFAFVFQMSSIVAEKELKLRQVILFLYIWWRIGEMNIVIFPNLISGNGSDGPV